MGDQRLERLLVLGIACDTEGAHATSVERVLEAYDVVLGARIFAAPILCPDSLSITARHLQRALVRFGSRIGKEHFKAPTIGGHSIMVSQAALGTCELY